MSGKLFGQALEAEVGSHVRKLVLLKLCDAADPDGTRIFPGKAAIARAAECTPRQVQRELRNFEAAGLLLVVAEASQHRPREYQLDLDVFGRVLKHGFTLVLNAAEAKAQGEAVRGDVVSPLGRDDDEDADDAGESLGPDLRGDMVSPLNADARGDMGDTQGRHSEHSGETSARGSLSDPVTPHDPSLRERGRDEENRKPEDDHAFQKLLKDYPGVNVPGRCFPLWQRLTPGERKEAQENLTAYLAAQHNLGRRHHHSLDTYLRGKLFNQVEAAGGAGAKFELQNRSRDWWIVFHNRRRSEGVDPKTGRSYRQLAKNMIDLFARQHNCGVSIEALPGEAERMRFVKIERGSDQYIAWQQTLRGEGYQIEHDNVSGAWIWVPSEWPPGVEAERARETG